MIKIVAKFLQRLSSEKFLFFIIYIYGEENGTQANKDSKFFIVFYRNRF